MPRKTPSPTSTVITKEWASTSEIERAIQKLERRKAELERLDVATAYRTSNGAIEMAASNLQEAIREVFGQQSPEFSTYESLELWQGPIILDMTPHDVISAIEGGKREAIGIVDGLIGRLKEKREDLVSDGTPTKNDFLRYLNLHPRIADVASELFENGHHWEAVFAASKALLNLVKERSGRDDLDGASLMRTVFSKNNPILAFNELSNQTDIDEQEGMMHLFEGVALAIRNPGGHSFPEGPEQRAVEYLSLISLLANRAQEAKKRMRK